MVVRCLLSALVAMVLAAGTVLADSREQEGLVAKARITIESLQNDEHMAALGKYLAGARGVLIVPQMLKAGFIVGGSGGSGVLLGRPGPDAPWSPPAFYTLGSGSVGLQIGAQAAELVLVIMTEKGLNSLLKTGITLGAEASVALGPVGAGVEAATAPSLSADIVAFSRTKGLFGGVAFEGAVVAPRDSWNAAFYGHKVTPGQIVLQQGVDNPKADLLRRAVTAAAGP